MPKISIDADFARGQSVYLKTDPDQYERIVIYIVLYPDCKPMYGLSCSDEGCSEHFAVEISETKKVF
jgi:hypothetical protein